LSLDGTELLKSFSAPRATMRASIYGLLAVFSQS
jgi:hypothetical protein